MTRRGTARLAALLGASRFAALLFGVTSAAAVPAPIASAATLSNDTFNLQTGTNGEISSLQLVGDAFPTNYVLNAGNAPGQNTADHEWVGELMFSYRLGAGAWQSALSQASADGRAITSTGTSVTVTYQNSANPQGIKNFKLVETYSLVADYLYWQIEITNTSPQAIEFGDVGLPLPFNEFWFANNDVIYETRTVYHSFTGNNSSYITVERPSGVGPFLLLTPDPATGAGFEYMDAWIQQEHPGSTWVAGGGTPSWPSGLDVFYIHSNVIKSTHRGYLPNTGLTLAPNASKTYAFKFFKVASQNEVKDRLYTEGLVDVTVVPGMMLSTDMNAKVDLHTSKPIHSVTPQYAAQTSITALGTAATDHNLYQLSFSQLGQNDVTVSYGAGETTTLQFYVLEPIGAALERHATFMVDKTLGANGTGAGVFDDWLLDSATKRNAFGANAWGDDWGWTHGEFLAEKNAQTPVASEVTALDTYLDAVWANQIDNTSYVVQDWWCPPGTSAQNPMNCFYDRPFAYPHAFNTYFSMYKIAHLYPNLVRYHSSADEYLLRAYDILHTLYSGHGNAGTGYMGEQTLPEISQALADGGHTAEASFVSGVITRLYRAFQNSKYPYGSEYSYDNTGEEAVYMSAKANADVGILGKVNAKTRACRGQEPVWYYYADPVTSTGENWWQFQYTAALAGYCMDDWLRSESTTPEVDERLSYAAKIANISAINSGQMDTNPENLGTVAWSYQAMKGDYYINSFDPPGKLHNGWRQMSGEADLGLFGAIRILSADVAVDPIFGLYGYGCDVTQVDGCYAVTPKDGVFKRLNLITEKFHMDLDRDRYESALISTVKDALRLTLQNQTLDTHVTRLTLLGLAPGTYDVSVDGVNQGTVTAVSGQPAVVPLSIGTDATYAVQIGSGCNESRGVADAGDATDDDAGVRGLAPPVAGGPLAPAGEASAGAAGSIGAGVASGGPGSGSQGCACTSAEAHSPSNRATAFLGLGSLAVALSARRRRYRAAA